MKSLILCNSDKINIIEKIDSNVEIVKFETLLEFLVEKDKIYKNIKRYKKIYIDLNGIDKVYYQKCGKIYWDNKGIGTKILDSEKEKLFILAIDLIISKMLYKNKIYNITFLYNGENEAIYKTIKKNNPSINTINYKTLEQNNIKYYLGEKCYPSNRNIRYTLENAKIFNKNKLIVIFSSFSKDSPKYNYRNTLLKIDCNKLFIMDDYGEKGSYYIGVDGNLEIETSVMSLITYIASEKNIKFKDIISIGSSKGGSAALYYGLKYNFGHVIAGVPQYKIGSYLCDLSIKNYANDIFGSDSISNRYKYDKIIDFALRQNQNTKINIITGEGDCQYERVLKEFKDVAELNNLYLDEKLINISGHNDIINKFPEYLINILKIILKRKFLW